DWKQSPYYDMVEGFMDACWSETIWPMVSDCDFSVVVDLAAGHGRNSEKLRRVAGRVHVVDIVAENVEFCRRRFAGDARFEFHLCDGKTFPAKPTLAELHVERALRALGPKRRPVRIARQGRRLGSGRVAFTRLPHRARARACLMNCTRMGSID